MLFTKEEKKKLGTIISIKCAAKIFGLTPETVEFLTNKKLLPHHVDSETKKTVLVLHEVLECCHKGPSI